LGRKRRNSGVGRNGVICLVIVLVMVAPRAFGASSLEEDVRRISAELRCPVCQGLSVADSPSRMADQMRDLIRERLQAGESPDAVKAYFVERYGEWILLTPKREGFNLLVWILPFLGLAGGGAALVMVLRRWKSRSAPASPSVNPAYLERVRREMTQDQS
jgi:cytochrome c-type biogenesis protein CcmH